VTPPPPVGAVVVTGLSGAGKSVVTRCFEDLGYRCVDNLPLDLIEPLFEHTREGTAQPLVVVVDVRTLNFTEHFPSLLARLRAGFPSLRVIFVEANTAAIVRRFSETRRPHPYRDLGIEEAVRLEREQLAAVRELADEIIDTSDLTPHELRAIVAGRFGSTEHALPMLVRCESFGFRFGLPAEASLVFDVRHLPNPHFEAKLRPLAGDDPEVSRWLAEKAEVGECFERMAGLCEYLLPGYRREQKSYVVIAFGCTGGRHRSVFMAASLAARLAVQGWRVAIHHRDRDRA